MDNRVSTSVPRQLPRWSQLRDVLVLEPGGRGRVRRRLDRAYSIADLRRIAKARTPAAVFDYVDGAAEQEVSLARARREYAGIRFHPRVLQGVSDVDTSVPVLGRSAPLPLVLAPTGFTRMMHHEGERAVAAAAADAGLPYTLSTMGTTSIEDVAAVAPGGRNWFQLYLWRDHGASRELIGRARAAGYDTLVLTVDTPVPGHRIRDDRNGLTIPPTLTPRTLAGMALHPEWWFNVLTTAPLEFATLSGRGKSLAELVGTLFDPGVTWTDLDWIRREWPGHLVVKGIQTVEDAVRSVDAGADAVVLSNHGGRQLDRAPTPLSLLPGTVAALSGRAEVYVDTGILTGADIAAAVALGATACLVGRAYLYGLMAGGRAGVAHAIGILRAEFTRTLQLLGVTRVADLNPEHVSLPVHPIGG